MELIEKFKALEKLLKKSLFGSEFGQSFPAADGTVLMLDPGMEEGAKVFINDQPAPNGDYVMPDGSTLTVIEGKVRSIAQKEAEPAPAAAAAPPTADPNASASEMAKQLERLQMEFDLIKGLMGFNADKKELSTLAFSKDVDEKHKALQEGITAILGFMEELSKQPATTPTTPVASPFAADAEAKEEKIKNISKFLKEQKKN